MMAAAIFRILSPLFCVAIASSCAGNIPAEKVAEPAAKTAAANTDRAAPAPVAEVPPEPAEPVRSDFWFNRSFEQGAVILARAPTSANDVKLDGQALKQTSDGFFLMGFNRDAPAVATLSWTSDGRQQARQLSITPGKWKIERVNLSLPRGRKASQRRQAELAQIRAARAENHDVDGWRQNFVWPVKFWQVPRGRISGLFGSQRYYRGQPGGYHTGLDIAAVTGTPYHAPADGVVTLATQSPFSREGYLLMVDHGNGLNSAFVHSAKLLVKKGDFVKQGQAIGHVGATGSATGPHLHWSMKWNAARVDPLLILPKR